MKIDKIRIKKFLLEIKRDSVEIKDFLKGNVKDKKTIKAIKYNLIEIVEARYSCRRIFRDNRKIQRRKNNQSFYL
ncbi:MAG: hypothetical protein B6D55_08585 [Candidatus Omnitrophica bacterium 4484_70.2]|nr:MAG: hypothetical protein B6D55_08585 [Candidatus Omnitrophica bacterium 4484_70.2]